MLSVSIWTGLHLRALSISRRLNSDTAPYAIMVPVKLRLHGVELKLVVEGPGNEKVPHPTNQ